MQTFASKGFLVLRRYAWISKLLRDAAVHDGRESCHVGLKSDMFRGILLSKQYSYYYGNVYEFRELGINTRFFSKTR